MSSIIDTFKSRMYQASIETDDPIIADGRLHRFHVLSDRKGTKNGWYILYADFPTVGVFGCWKRNIKQKWQLFEDSRLTIADLRKAIERRQMIQARCASEFKSELNAMRESKEIWQSAKPAKDSHGYLVKKDVSSHGLRYHNGALLIPVTDITGQFQGMQRIWPKGEKRFSKGTIMTGNFYMIAEPIEATLLICEGYSTGATLHESSGHAVVAAFNNSNLRPVAEAIRAAWPNFAIKICADDDHADPENPGLAAATEAAAAVGGELRIPIFPLNRNLEDSDFNDLCRISGKAAVLKCLGYIGGRNVRNI